MFDIGWSELLLIGIVALIVVGPKDLPRMFRTLGQFTGRARNMAREFQRALDSAADESGVKDMAKDLKSSIRTDDLGLDEFRDFSKGPKGWVKDQLADPDTFGDKAAGAAEAGNARPDAPASVKPAQKDAGGSYVPAAARKAPPAEAGDTAAEAPKHAAASPKEGGESA